MDWGGGSGPASRERWVPLLLSDSPAPVTANSGAPRPQLSGSGNSPTALPTTGRCRQVGARSPPGCCASSLLTCFGIFSPEESLGEGREMGRGSWRAALSSAALRAGSCTLCGLISEWSVVSLQDSSWRLLSFYTKRLAIPPPRPRSILFRADTDGLVVKSAASGTSRDLNPGFTTNRVTWGKVLKISVLGLFIRWR